MKASSTITLKFKENTTVSVWERVLDTLLSPFIPININHSIKYGYGHQYHHCKTLVQFMLYLLHLSIIFHHPNNNPIQNTARKTIWNMDQPL